MQNAKMQDIMTQDKENQFADADTIQYQVSLATEEAAYKLRNSVAKLSGSPPTGTGSGRNSQLQKPM